MVIVNDSIKDKHHNDVTLRLTCYFQTFKCSLNAVRINYVNICFFNDYKTLKTQQFKHEYKLFKYSLL